MADNQIPGSGAGADKNRRPQEVRNGGDVPANKDAKINSAMTNAKRRRQRRKFATQFKKSGLQLDSGKNNKNVRPELPKKSVQNSKPVPGSKSVLENKTFVKAERPETRHIREELHPRPLSPEGRRSGFEEKPAVPLKPEPLEKEKVEAESKKPMNEPEKPGHELVKPMREPENPILKPEKPESESKKTEEPDFAKVISEPAEQADIQSSGVTYFSHPFEPGEEGAVKQSDLTDEENELPVQEDVSAEGDITIGKEETSPPIPIGRIEKVEPAREEFIGKPESEVTAEKEDEAKVSVVESKKDKEEKDKKEEHLAERESSGKVLKSWLHLNWPRFTEFLKKVFVGTGRNVGGVLSHLSFGRVVSCLVLVLLIMGGIYGYDQKWHEKAYSYVSGLFQPKPVEKVEVKVNPADQNKFGITSTSIFGRNMGSVNDLIPPQISMALFFGELREPKVSGETGITALTYYGELKDGADVVNQFVVYMQNLEEVQNLYKTDVYAMLDRSSERDKVLLDYLEKLKQAREKSQVLHAQVKINMDDFKKSNESLNPDKTKYEQDFFTAMENLQSEKSDLLLKGFIDITQKQAALKARISALAKLDSYYVSALDKLDKRILAVEQNRDALIQGIRVVDIPGANLNIIIKSGQK